MTTDITQFKIPKVPDDKAIQKRTDSLLAQSKSFEIVSEDHFVASWSLIERHDAAIKWIGETFDPFVKALYELHRMACSLRGRFLEPIVKSKQDLLAKRSIYRREQDRIQQEANAKAAELLKKQTEKELTREAKKLERRGESEAAGVLFEQAKNVPTPAIATAPATPKLAGSVLTKFWNFEVIDYAKVPASFKTLDHTKKAQQAIIDSNLDAVISKLGDKAAELVGPGVRIFPDEREHSTSRKAAS